MIERALYKELLLRKEKGERLDIDQLTKAEFFQLWHKEVLTLAMIAELFGVSEYKIKKLKNSWGLNARHLTGQEHSEYLVSEYAKVRNLDEVTAKKEIERIKNKFELAEGKKYDNAIECFSQNEVIIWNNPLPL